MIDFQKGMRRLALAVGVLGVLAGVVLAYANYGPLAVKYCVGTNQWGDYLAQCVDSRQTVEHGPWEDYAPSKAGDKVVVDPSVPLPKTLTDAQMAKLLASGKAKRIEDGKISDEDLGRAVKTRFPGSYDDLSDTVLGQKVKAHFDVDGALKEGYSMQEIIGYMAIRHGGSGSAKNTPEVKPQQNTWTPPEADFTGVAKAPKPSVWRWLTFLAVLLAFPAVGFLVPFAAVRGLGWVVAVSPEVKNEEPV